MNGTGGPDLYKNHLLCDSFGSYSDEEVGGEVPVDRSLEDKKVESLSVSKRLSNYFGSIFQNKIARPFTAFIETTGNYIKSAVEFFRNLFSFSTEDDFEADFDSDCDDDVEGNASGNFLDLDSDDDDEEDGQGALLLHRGESRKLLEDHWGIGEGVFDDFDEVGSQGSAKELDSAAAIEYAAPKAKAKAKSVIAAAGPKSGARIELPVRPGSLTNIYNSCYMNSALQSLVLHPTMRNLILRNCSGAQDQRPTLPLPFDASPLNREETNLRDALQDSVMRLLDRGANESTLSDVRDNIFNFNDIGLDKSGRRGGLIEQQDATSVVQLFMRELLGQMYETETTLEGSSKKAESNHVLTLQFPKSVKDPEAEQLPDNDNDNSNWLTRLFGGQNKEVKKEVDFEDLLQSFFTPEHVDYRGEENVKKSIQFTKLPDVMAVQLGRFETEIGVDRYGNQEFIAKKITDNVRLKDGTVDFSKYLAPGAAEETARYKVSGIIIHQGGSANGGHYIAKVRQPDGSCFIANDDSISRISPQEFLDESQAYMLILERIKD